MKEKRQTLSKFLKTEKTQKVLSKNRAATQEACMLIEERSVDRKNLRMFLDKTAERENKTKRLILGKGQILGEDMLLEQLWSECNR